MVRAEVVLFDLDGTVSDSAAGILAALRHAFDVNGLPRLDPHAERALLGPPFYESLPPLIGASVVPGVIAAYRSYYGAGAMYDTCVFPGVREILADLCAAGVRLAIATSKPEPYASKIVDALRLAPYFRHVVGDDLDGSMPTKALVIGAALRRLANPDADSVLMVGDRSHDVLGARAHGIATLAVAWGYAGPGELAAAQPAAVCTSPGQLRAALGLDLADAQAS